jgi:hypothetical protein
LKKKNLKSNSDEVTNTEEESEELKESEEMQLFEKKIKIRIVVVDQDAKSAAKQSLKSFLSPVLSKMDVIPKLGMLF